eukprot:1514524-Alexandrium_andersonii.AAC.1
MLAERLALRARRTLSKQFNRTPTGTQVLDVHGEGSSCGPHRTIRRGGATLIGTMRRPLSQASIRRLLKRRLQLPRPRPSLQGRSRRARRSGSPGRFGYTRPGVARAR